MSLKGPDLKGVDSEKLLRYIRHPYYLNCFSTPRQGLSYSSDIEHEECDSSVISTRKASSLTLISVSLSQLRGRIEKIPCRS